MLVEASREVNPGITPLNWSSWALKWAVTDQFKEYLQYQPFLVRTDNNPLTYVKMTPNLDAVGHRWVAVMAGYNFEIEYVRGSDNKVMLTPSVEWASAPRQGSCQRVARSRHH